jgi:hypothetical protein
LIAARNPDRRAGEAAFCGCNFALVLRSSGKGFIEMLKAGWNDPQVSSGAEIGRHEFHDAIAGLA